MNYAQQRFALLAALLLASLTLQADPPMIESTDPTIGTSEVDPAKDRISVTFDQDMRGGFSWTGGGPNYPEVTGKPEWVTSRTCVLPVKLEKGRYYRVGINSTSHQNFRSMTGEPAPVRAIYFTTQGAPPEVKALVSPPTVTTFNPPNGATDVDPATTAIQVSFSRKMGGGRSLTGAGENFPQIAGELTWDASGQTIIVPVSLKPSWEYRMGINSFSHRNFASEEGVPVEPVVYTFKTRP
jgi:hypothetical protein